MTSDSITCTYCPLNSFQTRLAIDDQHQPLQHLLSHGKMRLMFRKVTDELNQFCIDHAMFTSANMQQDEYFTSHADLFGRVNL